jgi:hypothetical protein
MAGDPHRKDVVREKLIVEGERAIGRTACERLWDMVMNLPASDAAGIAASATAKGKDDRHAQTN